MPRRFYGMDGADSDEVLHRFTYHAREWARAHHQDGAIWTISVSCCLSVP